VIVGFEPGGTIRNARVVLKWDELLPNKYNTPEAVVYREEEGNPQQWILIKPLNETLPVDSPLLTLPEAPPEIFDLTISTEPVIPEFDNENIIRIDDDTANS
jgi:hypothetical protein